MNPPNPAKPPVPELDSTEMPPVTLLPTPPGSSPSTGGLMPLMARGYAFPYHPALARRQDCGAVSVSATPAAGPVHRVARSGHLHPASGDGGLHHLGPSGRKTSFVGGSQETRRRQRRLVMCAWSKDERFVSRYIAKAIYCII